MHISIRARPHGAQIRCIYTSTPTRALCQAIRQECPPLLPTLPSGLLALPFLGRPTDGDGMRAPASTKAFRQGFLKNLILSLHACSRAACVSSSSGGAAMSLQERKRAIKSSADIAMATSRGGGVQWPRAILASSSSRPPPPCKTSPGKVRRCKRIVRRCFHARRWPRDNNAAGGGASLARRLVRKRTKVLRKMIPGGDELLDEVSLLREAMDYVEHLHAQVDVLRRISNAVQ